jgi:predicted polyphosphate/ATP-dependent NAD kinase
MTSIGIIANPASGKDIRRLVSHATVIDNGEKINIVERIVLGAQAFGVEQVYIMSDSSRIGYRVKDKLTTSGELKCEIVLFDMIQYKSMKDSMNAAEYMEKNDVNCIVTLGGDGTNRAVAKVLKETPLITLSTGTNNAYPVMMEGTIAGMAAAAVASGRYKKSDYSIKDKMIEIYLNSKLTDIALVDAVVSTDSFVGSKAIWDMETIEKIFVTRCNPASIGFSSIVGCKTIIEPEDDMGAYVNVNKEDNNSYANAPTAAGIIEPVNIDDPKKLKLDEEFEYVASERGTIALDGEKEVEFVKGQKIIFKISRTGPNHVDVVKTLKAAQKTGFFLK